jgi:hypothetical protein
MTRALSAGLSAAELNAKASQPQACPRIDLSRHHPGYDSTTPYGSSSATHTGGTYKLISYALWQPLLDLDA